MEREMDPDLNRAEEPPELYAIDGAVPGELLEEYGGWLSRNPLHPGLHIAESCELKSVRIPEAAVQFGIECAELTAVIEGRAPVTPDLALRMEAAGWSPAAGWLGMQRDYDLAQERRRRERTGSVSAPETRMEDTVAVAR